MTENKQDIIWEVFNQMPTHFSSRVFAHKLKSKGISQNEIDNNIMKKFLRGKAIRKERSWTKLVNGQIPINLDKKGKKKEYDQQTIQKWVGIFKSLGLRVLKQKSEWEEL